MSDDRDQLEKDHALFVKLLISRFLKHLKDEDARVVVMAWQLRENGLTPEKIIAELGGRWEAEYVPRCDYYVFRRPRPQRARPIRIAYREPEGRWRDITTRAENRP